MRFTVHAVEQYINRWREGLAYPAALEELRAAVPQLRATDRLPDGSRVHVTNAGVRLVVKRERGGDICVTVLAPNEDALPDEIPRQVRDPAVEQQQTLSAVFHYLERRANRGDHEARRLLARYRLLDVVAAG